MEEKKNLEEKIDCPIHDKSWGMVFTHDNRTWGKRMCFKCVAEIVNQKVDQKQAEFLENSSHPQDARLARD